MHHRILGRTGLSIAEISLGTVELGLDYGISAEGEHLRPSDETAGELLHRALDLGINLIDTARAYGNSEEIIGRWLGSRRSEFVLVTKVQTLSRDEISPADRTARMEASIEESLRRLNTDHVDILLLHCATAEDAELRECIDVLEESRRQGLTRFIGASVYGPDAATRALQSGHYDCLEIAWSALDRRAEGVVIPEAERAGVALLIRSVLMRGALTRRWRALPNSLEPVRDAAARLERIADAAGLELPELAYRYVLSSRGPFTALAGTARLAELEACIRYGAAGPLSHDLLNEIRGIELTAELQDLSRWPAV